MKRILRFAGVHSCMVNMMFSGVRIYLHLINHSQPFPASAVTHCMENFLIRLPENETFWKIDADDLVIKRMPYVSKKLIKSNNHAILARSRTAAFLWHVLLFTFPYVSSCLRSCPITGLLPDCVHLIIVFIWCMIARYAYNYLVCPYGHGYLITNTASQTIANSNL